MIVPGQYWEMQDLNDIEHGGIILVEKTEGRRAQIVMASKPQTFTAPQGKRWVVSWDYIMSHGRQLEQHEINIRPELLKLQPPKK